MTYDEALESVTREQKFMGTVYAMNTLLCGLVYPREEFERLFIEWVEKQSGLWKVTLWCDGMVPPSLNVMKRMEFHVYGRLRETWKNVLYHQLDARRRQDKRNLQASAEDKVPVRIRFTVFHPRLFDYDNLVGGCKLVLDALKVSKQGLGWIAGDSPALCSVTYEQVKSTRLGTEISISPRGERTDG